jgi:hypothetical protein
MKPVAVYYSPATKKSGFRIEGDINPPDVSRAGFSLWRQIYEFQITVITTMKRTSMLQCDIVTPVSSNSP